MGEMREKLARFMTKGAPISIHAAGTIPASREERKRRLEQEELTDG
jgi:hypothetical protein